MSSNSETIFNQAYNNGKRGNALLEVALELPDFPAESLIAMLACDFPEEGARDDDPFTWIPTVEKFGASKEIIMELVFQVLFFNDYPNDLDGATPKCEALIRYAARHHALVTKQTFIRMIDQITRHNPNFILKYFTTISWVFAKYNGAPDWVNTGSARAPHEIFDAMHAHDVEISKQGEGEAMPHLRRACDEVRVIWTMAEVEAILRLPLDARQRVVKRVIPDIWNKGAVVPPVRNLATVYLMIQVLVSGGPNDDLERVLIDSLRWKSSDPSRNDPERAVRLFRWYLKYLAEVPVQREEWMGRWHAPEGMRELIASPFVDKCRKALKASGFTFAYATSGSDPHGNTRMEVQIVDGVRTKIYIHDTRGARNEARITDGSEVIVPNFVSSEPLFRRRDAIGWRLEFHPVAPPSSTMERQAWDNGGNF